MLAPKWFKEFKVYIITWEMSNVLKFKACNKDHLFDDALGNCSVDVNDIKDGQDMTPLAKEVLKQAI